ncbi:MAG TPA: hypothetical protein VFZ16_01885 [Hyphomicrobiaceae bacterium]|nr:hypothetical protein [Hyphomicrobiaceae bacterium]
MRKQFLKSLHFLMLNHDLTKDPGRYRPGSIRVVEKKTFATEGDVAGVVRG